MTHYVDMIRRKLQRLFGRRCHNGIAFDGDYDNWPEAAKNSTGYSAEVILARTRVAQLKVKRGEAVFERDSVIFDQPEWPWPVLACLLKIAAGNGGRLSVLDFGGALGSTYFSCRRFFTPLAALRWSVIEQPAYVACGRQEFQDDQLHFYHSLDDCLAHERPDVLLLSSVLQYLPTPHETLRALLACRMRQIIIDRTAFNNGARDRLTVQTVPEWIYRASYPAWFFTEKRFLMEFDDSGYYLVTGFPGTDRVSLVGSKPYYKGFLFELREVP